MDNNFNLDMKPQMPKWGINVITLATCFAVVVICAGISISVILAIIALGKVVL